MFEQGHYDAAYDGFTEEFLTWKRPAALCNRGLLLLKCDRLQEAIVDFQTCIQLRGDNEYDYMMLGVAHWIAGGRTEAVNVWNDGIGRRYTDAAGGVELPGVIVAAGTLAGDEGLAERGLALLKKQWKPRLAKVWPGPIAGLYAGRLTVAEFEEGAVSKSSALQARYRCQVDFHAGIHALRNSDHRVARQRISAAAQNGGALTRPEHYLATDTVKTIGDVLPG